MAQSALDIILRTKKTGTGASETRKELDKTAESASRLGEVAGGLLKAGLAAAAGAAVKAVTDTANYNREVRLLAQSINATTEETSRLVQVADDVGVSQDALTRSLQLASKNGFAPTIDNIARLADETRAMVDPTEKAAALSKVFGRGWAEVAPFLAMGGKAIKENAAAISDSLIVTAKASKATRDFEIAQDNLGDAVAGLSHEFGNLAIPVVTKFFNLLKEGVETADLLVHWQERIVKVQQEHEAEVRTSARTYQEYITEIIRANGASEEQALILRDVERGLIDEAEGARLVAQATGAMTEAQFNASRGAYGIAGALDESNRAATRAADEARNAAGAIDEEGKAADVAAEKILTKAEADNAAALAAMNATTAFLGMATSLTTANDPVDIAKTALSALQEQLDSGKIGASQFNQAYQALGLSAGLVTKESLASSRGIEMINEAFVSGLILPSQYSEAIGLLPQAAADGVVTLKEVGLGSLETMRKSKQDIMDEAGNAAGDVVSKTSQAVSDSMLKVSNAVSATNSLIGLTGEALQNKVIAKWEDFEKMPNIVKTITFNIETNGQIPTGIPGRAGGGPVRAGVPVNVDEIFREQLVPYQSGSMMPANNYSTTVAKGAIVIDARQSTSIDAIVAEVSQRLARELRSARATRSNG